MKRRTLGIALAALTIAAAGCVSDKTNSGVTPHTLRVIDAVTKLPVVGAEVKLSAPGMTMINRTDERGMIDAGSLAFASRPKPENMEITRQGYNRVLMQLTNGLPPTVELTPVQSQR